MRSGRTTGQGWWLFRAGGFPGWVGSQGWWALRGESAAGAAVDNCLRFTRVEAESRVHGLDGSIEVVKLGHNGDANLGGGDQINIDARR